MVVVVVVMMCDVVSACCCEGGLLRAKFNPFESYAIIFAAAAGRSIGCL